MKGEKRRPAKGYGVSRDDENSLKLIVVMVAELCEYIKNHCII